MTIVKSILLWTFSLLALVLNGLIAFICLSEWYFVGILNKHTDYHFGGEGPGPYYYRTKELYVLVSQIWGIIFILNLVFLIWAILKGQRKTRVFAIILTWIILLLMILHGSI
jgi:hypothetical protein